MTCRFDFIIGRSNASKHTSSLVTHKSDVGIKFIPILFGKKLILCLPLLRKELSFAKKDVKLLNLSLN